MKMFLRKLLVSVASALVSYPTSTESGAQGAYQGNLNGSRMRVKAAPLPVPPDQPQAAAPPTPTSPSWSASAELQAPHSARLRDDHAPVCKRASLLNNLTQPRSPAEASWTSTVSPSSSSQSGTPIQRNLRQLRQQSPIAGMRNRVTATFGLWGAMTPEEVVASRTRVSSARNGGPAQRMTSTPTMTNNSNGGERRGAVGVGQVELGSSLSQLPQRQPQFASSPRSSSSTALTSASAPSVPAPGSRNVSNTSKNRNYPASPYFHQRSSGQSSWLPEGRPRLPQPPAGPAPPLATLPTHLLHKADQNYNITTTAGASATGTPLDGAPPAPTRTPAAASYFPSAPGIISSVTSTHQTQTTGTATERDLGGSGSTASIRSATERAAQEIAAAVAELGKPRTGLLALPSPRGDQDHWPAGSPSRGAHVAEADFASGGGPPSLSASSGSLGLGGSGRHHVEPRRPVERKQSKPSPSIFSRPSDLHGASSPPPSLPALSAARHELRAFARDSFSSTSTSALTGGDRGLRGWSNPSVLVEHEVDPLVQVEDADLGPPPARRPGGVAAAPPATADPPVVHRSASETKLIEVEDAFKRLKDSVVFSRSGAPAPAVEQLGASAGAPLSGKTVPPPFTPISFPLSPTVLAYLDLDFDPTTSPAPPTATSQKRLQTSPAEVDPAAWRRRAHHARQLFADRIRAKILEKECANTLEIIKAKLKQGPTSGNRGGVITGTDRSSERSSLEVEDGAGAAAPPDPGGRRTSAPSIFGRSAKSSPPFRWASALRKCPGEELAPTYLGPRNRTAAGAHSWSRGDAAGAAGTLLSDLSAPRTNSKIYLGPPPPTPVPAHARRGKDSTPIRTPTPTPQPDDKDKVKHDTAPEQQDHDNSDSSGDACERELLALMTWERTHTSTWRGADVFSHPFAAARPAGGASSATISIPSSPPSLPPRLPDVAKRESENVHVTPKPACANSPLANLFGGSLTSTSLALQQEQLYQSLLKIGEADENVVGRALGMDIARTSLLKYTTEQKVLVRSSPAVLVTGKREMRPAASPATAGAREGAGATGGGGTSRSFEGRPRPRRHWLAEPSPSPQDEHARQAGAVGGEYPSHQVPDGRRSSGTPASSLAAWASTTSLKSGKRTMAESSSRLSPLRMSCDRDGEETTFPKNYPQQEVLTASATSMNSLDHFDDSSLSPKTKRVHDSIQAHFQDMRRLVQRSVSDGGIELPHAGRAGMDSSSAGGAPIDLSSSAASEPAASGALRGSSASEDLDDLLETMPTSRVRSKSKFVFPPRMLSEKKGGAGRASAGSSASSRGGEPPTRHPAGRAATSNKGALSTSAPARQDATTASNAEDLLRHKGPNRTWYGEAAPGSRTADRINAAPPPEDQDASKNRYLLTPEQASAAARAAETDAEDAARKYLLTPEQSAMMTRILTAYLAIPGASFTQGMTFFLQALLISVSFEQEEAYFWLLLYFLEETQVTQVDFLEVDFRGDSRVLDVDRNTKSAPAPPSSTVRGITSTPVEPSSSPPAGAAGESTEGTGVARLSSIMPDLVRQLPRSLFAPPAPAQEGSEERASASYLPDAGDAGNPNTLLGSTTLATVVGLPASLVGSIVSAVTGGGGGSGSGPGRDADDGGVDYNGGGAINAGVEEPRPAQAAAKTMPLAARRHRAEIHHENHYAKHQLSQYFIPNKLYPAGMGYYPALMPPRPLAPSFQQKWRQEQWAARYNQPLQGIGSPPVGGAPYLPRPAPTAPPTAESLAPASPASLPAILEGSNRENNPPHAKPAFPLPHQEPRREQQGPQRPSRSVLSGYSFGLNMQSTLFSPNWVQIFGPIRFFTVALALFPDPAFRKASMLTWQFRPARLLYQDDRNSYIVNMTSASNARDENRDETTRSMDHMTETYHREAAWTTWKNVNDAAGVNDNVPKQGEGVPAHQHQRRPPAGDEQQQRESIVLRGWGMRRERAWRHRVFVELIHSASYSFSEDEAAEDVAVPLRFSVLWLKIFSGVCAQLLPARVLRILYDLALKSTSRSGPFASSGKNQFAFSSGTTKSTAMRSGSGGSGGRSTTINRSASSTSEDADALFSPKESFANENEHQRRRGGGSNLNHNQRGELNNYSQYFPRGWLFLPSTPEGDVAAAAGDDDGDQALAPTGMEKSLLSATVVVLLLVYSDFIEQDGEAEEEPAGELQQNDDEIVRRWQAVAEAEALAASSSRPTNKTASTSPQTQYDEEELLYFGQLPGSREARAGTPVPWPRESDEPQHRMPSWRGWPSPEDDDTSDLLTRLTNSGGTRTSEREEHLPRHDQEHDRSPHEFRQASAGAGAGAGPPPLTSREALTEQLLDTVSNAGGRLETLIQQKGPRNVQEWRFLFTEAEKWLDESYFSSTILYKDPPVRTAGGDLDPDSCDHVPQETPAATSWGNKAAKSGGNGRASRSRSPAESRSPEPGTRRRGFLFGLGGHGGITPGVGPWDHLNKDTDARSTTECAPEDHLDTRPERPCRRTPRKVIGLDVAKIVENQTRHFVRSEANSPCSPHSGTGSAGEDSSFMWSFIHGYPIYGLCNYGY